jgi:hypothetical protein
LEVQQVSAFVSHSAFCTVGPFDSPDALHAMPSRIHTGRKNNPDSCSAKHVPESSCVSFGISAHDSISVFLQPAYPAQKTARTRHTSFPETIQVDP